jgi:formylglycine-generating enzyme required for sulfatase activity
LAGVLIAAAAVAVLWWTGWSPASHPQTADTRGTGAPLPEEPAGPVAGDAGPPPPPARPPVLGKARDAGGPEMIVLAPADFTMGNAFGMSPPDARPAHEVALDAFLIGAREVTFDEYDRFVRATGARRPEDFGRGRGEQPVVDVSWDDAVAYTRWLSRQTGKSYRLPSEAEWEYAARAGSESMYWWGYEDPDGRAVCFDCGSPFDRRGPAPAGYSGPNAFGLYDTAGNVYEWVADCYRPSYRGAPTDGGPVDDSGCRQRAARGGSYKSPIPSIRVYARRALEPDTRTDAIGFRVARDAG